MRLVACATCHAQFDVEGMAADRMLCACGAEIPIEERKPVDAPIHRCGACGASVAPTDETCSYCDSVIVRDVTRLSLLCPECYSRNAEDASFCNSCGVRFLPQALPGAGPGYPCPACDRQLSPRIVGEVPLHECGGCNGIWVPEDGFDLLVNKAIDAARTRPSRGIGLVEPSARVSRGWRREVVYRKCPECGGTMQRKNFARRSGVIVDWCGKHGTWLDADELEEIARYVLAGGLEKAAGAEDFRMTPDPDKLRALYESEKLLADEKAKSLRMKKTLELDTSDTLRTLGDFLSNLLDG